MARLRHVVIDCGGPARLAQFWAAALDGYSVAPYNDEELARLRGLGIDGPEDDPTVLVRQPGVTPRLWFQAVPEGKVVKNCVHLDLDCDDATTEIARLRGLGASVPSDQPNDDLITLLDPEGNEFCLLRQPVANVSPETACTSSEQVDETVGRSGL